MGFPPKDWRWTMSRFGELLRWEGVRGLVLRTLPVVGYRSVGRYVRSLEEPVPLRTASLPVSFEELNADDQDDYVAFRRGTTAAQFSSRRQAGNRCFVARHDGKLVAALWVATGRAQVGFLRREIELDPGEIYLFDAYTLPEHRGRHLQPMIVSRTLARFQEEGYRQALSLIAPHNRPNITVRERAGFRRVGTIGCVILGPFRYDFSRGNRRAAESVPPDGTEPARRKA